MDQQQHGTTSEQTREFEEDDASRSARADRPPTEAEAAAADRNEPDPDVAAAYEHAMEVGAEVRGEGQIGGDR